MVDREQIRQVMLNLLLNSIKAMQSGGRLTIRATHAHQDPRGSIPPSDAIHVQSSQFIRVVIADTGSGIAPHRLPKVFDPFFTTDPRGTGLGLAIAHKLIEENQGYIFMDSVEGEGTSVLVLLPIAGLTNT
jgi:signal transduction histidine kinase